MEYPQDFIPIHKNCWEKLCFALIYGALKDIVLFAQSPSHETLLQQTLSLSYKDRRIKMKEYLRIKRRSEKACEWIDNGAPKRGGRIMHVSFQEACEGLKQEPEKVRNNIKNIIREVVCMKT